jgi:2,5-diamino-6-(ribosylamino)-4(3H)-pyrimidinone 5'-phosphate reductase
MELHHFVQGTRPYLDLVFPTAPAGRPYVIVNMVGSIDGKAVLDGTEQGLGSAQDKSRMQELRAHADAVMNGAGTMRKSGATSRIDDPALVRWRHEHGKEMSFPLGCLVTTRAAFDLSGDYFDGSGVAAVIFASAISPERTREIEARGPSVVTIPNDGTGMRHAMSYLYHERGVQLLLVEGGPTLNDELLRLGLIDEFFLTLGPTLVGGRETLTILAGAEPYPRASVPRAALLAVIANDEASELYLRYRLHAVDG